MLTNNTRALSVSVAHKLTRSDSLPSDMPAPYGRILDEHIVLEELNAWNISIEVGALSDLSLVISIIGTDYSRQPTRGRHTVC
jgi:hypothetical protein